MKKYEELYDNIKAMISSGQLTVGDKLPSVRKAAEIYSLSVTTVQNAYFDLCADGYVIARNKSGYYVARSENHKERSYHEETKSKIKYNLSGGIADSDCFDIALWQRYIKSALRQKDRLLSYSQPKGEYDLRCAVSDYIREKRNVTASPERIIIGAGVQPLLQILCALLQKNKTVSFPTESFVQGIGTFKDYGFNVRTRYKDADIIYVSPSHMTRWGDVMPIKRRLELVEYSHNNGSLVIEDDYENEFLYNVKPTPSLYALGKGNIIYIGSFSAMLIPSIRISFMVLTDELTEIYNKYEFRFCQTASKTEQIALCNYIRDGHIKSQIRKVRRTYCAKAKKFCEVLKSKMPDKDISIGENNLQIILKTDFSKDLSVFEKEGLKVLAEKKGDSNTLFILSPIGIKQENFDDVATLIKSIIE